MLASHLGIEPRTFGLEVQRAILCANGTWLEKRKQQHLLTENIMEGKKKKIKQRRKKACSFCIVLILIHIISIRPVSSVGQSVVLITRRSRVRSPYGPANTFTKLNSLQWRKYLMEKKRNFTRLKKLSLPDRESNPGLPRDRRRSSPLDYRGILINQPLSSHYVRITLIGDLNKRWERPSRGSNPGPLG